MNFRPQTHTAQNAAPERCDAACMRDGAVSARLGFDMSAAIDIDVSSKSPSAEDPSPASTTTQVSPRSIYANYISSHAWRNSPARLAELKAASFRCRTCNASADDVQLEVHHRTYERLGCEKVEDLTALCPECHRSVTSDLRRRRYSRRTPVFGNVDIGNCRVPLFDPMPRGDWS
jgi:5-methylcytosine-specific restriction endonuclease McrA